MADLIAPAILCESVVKGWMGKKSRRGGGRVFVYSVDSVRHHPGGQRSSRESRSPLLPCRLQTERAHRTVGGRPGKWTNSGRVVVSTSNGIGNHAMQASTPCTNPASYVHDELTPAPAWHGALLPLSGLRNQATNDRGGRGTTAEPRPVIARRSSEVLPRCTRASPAPGPRSHPTACSHRQKSRATCNIKLRKSAWVPCNQDRGLFFATDTGQPLRPCASFCGLGV